MRPSLILDVHREAILKLALQYRLTNPRVFGSVLNGTDREGSDIDLLVDPLPGATLFHLGGYSDAWQTLTGMRVDVITPGLPARMRDAVLVDARPI
jgi:predicted nucleotidyltransferase